MLEEDDAPTGGDFGRRVAALRAELRMSREELAERAEMSPGYVAYLEEHAPRITRQALYRLAGALHTTQDHLLGADTRVPPGAASTAIPLPVVTALPERECRELISSGGVGRVGFVAEGGAAPVILPVNYLVRDGAVVFRTADRGLIARHLPADVAFEVDRVDGAMSEGWSVLIAGRAEPLTGETASELRDRGAVRPWAGGDLDLFVRIVPARITGRRVGGGWPRDGAHDVRLL
ncbi:helix-turn-helix domain-containing protein [Nocardiopsis metallicus]|uniref:Transcriptional regulator with XRE-family HTH domain n=1 Tax=Nocardiopsis metallicus TaxID=179819 RepID=A0A840W9D9_9ACTN|nr:pyridoxamine 5'-phosphate oxidase family protein [Nocardiopsis metallicus]MBB5491993.1 transcriptional regulator with XRE-family HTH domain [Nocardiopsis metallicus]